MIRLIVLEGPDGAGKTTLAKKLQEQFNYSYLHHGPPGPGENAFDICTRSLLRLPGPTVIDRLHLGDLVYGPHVRGSSDLGEYGVALLDRMIHALGGITVICLPPYEDCLRKWRGNIDNELIKDEEVLYQIYKHYYQLGARYPTVNYRHEQEIPGFLRFTELPTCPDGVLGWPMARVVVVGEQVNPNRNRGANLPFHDLNGSSKFLTDRLYQAGFKEHELAFTNIAFPSGEILDLKELNVRLNKPEFIFLGKLAAKEALYQGFDRHFLNHPQHVKRFSSGDHEFYIRQLREVREHAIAT